jgi:hypothetical protein
MLRLSMLMAATVLVMPLSATAPRGYEVRDAVVKPSPEGAGLHGRVCRQSFAPPPTRMQAEHLSTDGRVLDSTSQSLSGLSRRSSPCTVFDLETHWTLGSGETIRLCALRSGGACGAS